MVCGKEHTLSRDNGPLQSLLAISAPQRVYKGRLGSRLEHAVSVMSSESRGGSGRETPVGAVSGLCDG